jgi:hypothetical protein
MPHRRNKKNIDLVTAKNFEAITGEVELLEP